MLFSLAAATALLGAEEGVFDLGKVDVTSTSETIAGTTTVIDAQTMRDTDSKTVVEAVNLLPGTYVQNNGGRNEQMIMIRGFDVKHAPLFIDGIPIAVAYDGYVDFSRFTTFDLSEIEVSKGLVSPLMGANVFAGAVNMVTKKPTKKFEGDAGGGLASGSGKDGYINLGTNQGSYYVQASVSRMERETFPLSDDFVVKNPTNEDGGDRNNAYGEDNKINLKFGYTPNETDEYAINFISQKAKKGVPPHEKDDLAKRGFWQWDRWDKQSLYFLSKTYFDNWYIKTRLFDDEFDNSLATYTNNGLYDTLNGTTGNPSWYDDYTRGGSVESGVNLSKANTLKFAAHYKIDNHKEGGANQVEVYEMEDSISSIGIEDVHQFSDTLKLVIGASYDKEEIELAQNTNYGRKGTTYYIGSPTGPQTQIYSNTEEFDQGDTSAFNPMFKFEGNYGDSISWYGGVAGKSRIPTIKDRYSFRIQTFIPNPELEPEETINYEIGGTRTFGDFTVGGALFYADVTNYIQDAYIPVWAGYTKKVNGVEKRFTDQQKQLQNIGEVTQKGLEISAMYMPSESLMIQGSYTYLDMTNEIDESQKITDVPKNKLIVMAAYTLFGGLTWFNTYEYTSERYAAVGTTGKAPDVKNTYETVDSVILWNTKATYQATDALAFDLGVNNVLDRNNYYSYGYPEPGRVVFGNVRYTF